MSLIFYLFIISSANAQIVGAKQSPLYMPMLLNKNIALVVNQTSMVDSEHLIDYLLNKKVNLKRLFALEHGIRGDHDAGQTVDTSIDQQTGLPIISLYGKNKKPQATDLSDIDVIIFDIQDIGVRFYTYISSLYYILESCANFQKTCIIFDRPNPNANVVAGPVLDMSLQSFVGMYPIPVIYGLTMGELGKMIIGEKWVKGDIDLKVIPVLGWKRADIVKLPIKPSPNLPNMNSIAWYPSLALFEPTQMSIGRGTKHPFEVIGFPHKAFGEFQFTPKSIKGMSLHPKHENKICYGEDLRTVEAPNFTLTYFMKYLDIYGRKGFVAQEDFFHKLIGDKSILKKLLKNESLEAIEASWKLKINDYKTKREKYLIYE